MVWRSVASHGELLYQLHVAEAGLPGSIQGKIRTSVGFAGAA
jgi:hypothetical protein